MKTKQRKKNWVPLAILLAVLAGVAIFFALFYVPNENVEVLGNTRYQNSEIRKIAMPGIMDHNALFLRLFRKSIQTDEVPFIDSIDVEYMGRDRIRLHVNEDYPVGYLLQDGYRMYFDSVGLVIEAIDAEEEEIAEREELKAEAVTVEDENAGAEDTENKAEEETDNKDEEKTDGKAEEKASSKGEGNTDKKDADGTSNDSTDSGFRPALTDVAKVTGLTTERVVPGEVIRTGDNSIFQTLLVLNKLINKLEITPDEIEIGEEQELTLHYDKVRIALGKPVLLEEKVSRASAILPQLKDMEGTLHLEHYTSETINIIFEQDKKEEVGKDAEQGEGSTGTTDLVGIGTDRDPAEGETTDEDVVWTEEEQATYDEGADVEWSEEYAGETTEYGSDETAGDTVEEWVEEGTETWVDEAETGA